MVATAGGLKLNSAESVGGPVSSNRCGADADCVSVGELLQPQHRSAQPTATPNLRIFKSPGTKDGVPPASIVAGGGAMFKSAGNRPRATRGRRLLRGRGGGGGGVAGTGLHGATDHCGAGGGGGSAIAAGG